MVKKHDGQYFDFMDKFSLNKYSFGVLDDTVGYSDKVKEEEKEEFEKLDLSKIHIVDFPDTHYYREPTDKNQIILHHTVSGRGVDGDINWWLSNKSRIATAVLVDYKGDIYQCFSSKYWAHHLGLKQEFLKSRGFKDYTSRNVRLNKRSIGIEIDAWGGLVRMSRKWYPAKWDPKQKKYIANIVAGEVKNVTYYSNGYRGFQAFESYTDEQISIIRKLLVYWGDVYNIPLSYNEEMWDVSNKALSGESGIWSHTSYRSDKSDIHPQKELIEMLKGL